MSLSLSNKPTLAETLRREAELAANAAAAAPVLVLALLALLEPELASVYRSSVGSAFVAAACALTLAGALLIRAQGRSDDEAEARHRLQGFARCVMALALFCVVPAVLLILAAPAGVTWWATLP